MEAHILEPPDTRARPAGHELYAPFVTSVGTFASGQSGHGSLQVAADAEVGSFADGLADDAPSETA